jgi:hypothetical protein
MSSVVMIMVDDVFLADIVVNALNMLVNAQSRGGGGFCYNIFGLEWKKNDFNFFFFLLFFL